MTPFIWFSPLTWVFLFFYSWFAIHPVSMKNTNHLVNSDNVGYASYLFEQEKNKGYLPGEVRIYVPESFISITEYHHSCSVQNSWFRSSEESVIMDITYWEFSILSYQERKNLNDCWLCVKYYLYWWLHKVSVSWITKNKLKIFATYNSFWSTWIWDMRNCWCLLLFSKI